MSKPDSIVIDGQPVNRPTARQLLGAWRMWAGFRLVMGRNPHQARGVWRDGRAYAIKWDKDDPYFETAFASVANPSEVLGPFDRAAMKAAAARRRAKLAKRERKEAAGNNGD